MFDVVSRVENEAYCMSNVLNNVKIFKQAESVTKQIK